MIIRKVRIKILDVLVFSLSFAAIVALGFKVYGQSSGDWVAVITSLEGRWVFPLSTEQILTPADLQGGCIVFFHNGSVRVVRSDCPEQICIRMGRISRPGQWIACLPHRIFIEIEGRDKDPVDAINF